MAIIPHPPQLPGEPSDKIQHIMAFLVLGGWRPSPTPCQALLLGVGLSLFGALIELVQYIPALHRDSDPVDWIADTIAAAVVLLMHRPAASQAQGGRRGPKLIVTCARARVAAILR